METGMRKLPVFNMIIMVQFLLLLIEFIVGISVNLYAVIPNTLTGSFFMSSGGIILMAHIGLGALVSIVAAILFFLALIKGERRTVVFTAMAFVLILLAAISGLVFVLAGQNSVFSLLMAVFFILAFSMYMFPLAELMRRISNA